MYLHMNYVRWDLDWNDSLPMFQDITNTEMDAIYNVASYTLNFWFVPK